MNHETAAGQTATLRDYLTVVRRRKWMILQAVVLVPAAALAFSFQQAPLYEAKAEVLLSRQNLASALTGTPDPTAYQQADRLAQTQAELASVPEVADRVLDALGIDDRTAEELIDASDVSAKQNADLLVFTVRDAERALAAALATAYAREFTDYRRELDTAALERAREDVRSQLDALEANGERDGPLYASLAEKEQQLATLEALQTSNAFVVRDAAEGEQVQPRPLRNGVLGLALGLVLGIGLAFLREALDTRVRSGEEVAERLGMPMLARLPEPPRRLRAHDRLVMFAEPNGSQAEMFRMLRTNLDFARLDRDVRTIMVTSSVAREGKSTTAANLAVALARAGQRVILVDLDLRRPYVDRFFHVDGRPGVTQVALGHADLRDALVPIAVRGVDRKDADAAPAVVSMTASGNGNGNGNGNGHVPTDGALRVVRSGPIPPDAGEFIATQTLTDLLGMLRQRADVVIVDAPPILQVGDAMTLSAKVDAIVVVTRLNVVRRPMLAELRRALDAAPAVKLGFVLTGAQSGDEGYGYGYYAGTYQAPERAPAGVE